jgi:hypothetical protein
MLGLDVDLNGNVVVTGYASSSSKFLSTINGNLNGGNGRAFAIFFELTSNRIKWYKEIYDPSTTDFIKATSPSFSFDGSLIASIIGINGAVSI